MLSIVSSHLLLDLLKILHVQVVNDSLAHSKLVFKLTLVMIFNPLRERRIIQRHTLAKDFFFKSHFPFPLIELIFCVSHYLFQAANIEKIVVLRGFIHIH